MPPDTYDSSQRRISKTLAGSLYAGIEPLQAKYFITSPQEETPPVSSRFLDFKKSDLLMET
jgi:hypothetical protein